MPFKDFADLEVLYASDVDTYLMRQAVMVFSSSAARSSAIGTAVAEGMVTYLTDSNAIEYYTGSAWTPVVPTTINATNVITTQTNSTATSYTFGSADSGTLVRFTSASTVTATISTATSLTAGQRIDVLRDGAGQVNITAGSGVTLAGAGTAASAFSIVQYEAASILCVASNEYRVIGNVTAI